MHKDKKFDIRFKAVYFLPKYWFSWLGILFLGLLAFIPVVIRDFIADVISFPLAKINIKFKRFCFMNFKYAFPHYSDKDNEKLYYDFIRVGLKVILGYGEPLFRSKKYINKTLMVTGKEYLDEALQQGRPIVFMAPHAWAIDHCGLYLSSSGIPMCTMMHTSKNIVYDWFMNSMRMKFGGKIYERDSGIRTIFKAMKDGYHSFFLPDQDLGRESSVFVPFFGKMKSSLITIPKLAKLSNAVILPMFSCYNEKYHKYELVFDEYFKNYPTGNIENDVLTMNQSIEKLILGREEQYMWFLKIYKTTEKEGDPGSY